MSEAKILGLPEIVMVICGEKPACKGIRITERSEIEGIALARYYPRRLKRLHYWDEFSRDLFQFKKFYDVALVERFAKMLAGIVRETGRQFDVCTFPPASRSRLYYPTAHLTRATATMLDLDLLDCLRWAGGKGESQKKRKGGLKLKRLGEFVECASDLTDLRILLIDDILTTGLTASRCVEALKFAGAESVFCAIGGWTVSEDTDGFQSVKFKNRF
jgi:predicted amidophosphoribosyltransferase